MIDLFRKAFQGAVVFNRRTIQNLYFNYTQLTDEDKRYIENMVNRHEKLKHFIANIKHFFSQNSVIVKTVIVNKTVRMMVKNTDCGMVIGEYYIFWGDDFLRLSVNQKSIAIHHLHWTISLKMLTNEQSIFWYLSDKTLKEFIESFIIKGYRFPFCQSNFDNKEDWKITVEFRELNFNLSKQDERRIAKNGKSRLLAI